MKNIQVIDGAQNCVYDIFQATETDFDLIFPKGTNIAFAEEVFTRREKAELERAIGRLWSKPIAKSQANGIHGILFYGLLEKKKYYPTLKDEEAVNPDGSRLRGWEP